MTKPINKSEFKLESGSKPAFKPIPDTEFESILSRTETGTESLRNILKSMMIGKGTWNAFILANPEKGIQYAQAKAEQSENCVDEIHQLELKCLEEIKACNPKVANAIQAAYRTQIDTVKWIASKLKPKKYGERLNVDQDTTLHITIKDQTGKEIVV